MNQILVGDSHLKLRVAYRSGGCETREPSRPLERVAGAAHFCPLTNTQGLFLAEVKNLTDHPQGPGSGREAAASGVSGSVLRHGGGNWKAWTTPDDGAESANWNQERPERVGGSIPPRATFCEGGNQ